MCCEKCSVLKVSHLWAAAKLNDQCMYNICVTTKGYKYRGMLNYDYYQIYICTKLQQLYSYNTEITTVTSIVQ